MLKRCRVCGTEYDTCYSCEKVRSWRTLTDTADHYYILGVLMEYKSGRDAKKAYDALRKRNVDFHDTGRFLPGVQKLLDEIYALAQEKSKAKKAPVLLEEPKADDAIEPQDIPVVNTEEE